MRIEGVFPDPRGQRFSQELVVVLVLLLDLSLSPLPHPIADVALEPEAQSHHWVTNTESRSRE
jgi:hypothetical protein